MASLPKIATWLAKNGPKELELLFRAIVYNPSAPVLIADNDGASIDASAGAGKLFGLPREKIIGRQIEEFMPPGSKPEVSQLWRAFLERGEQEGTLQLVAAGRNFRPRWSSPPKATYYPCGMPLRCGQSSRRAHIGSQRGPHSVVGAGLCALLTGREGTRCRVVLRERSAFTGIRTRRQLASTCPYFIRTKTRIASAYSHDFQRAEAEGHVGAEGWQARKDGSRFWANTITMALKDENGDLQGFARVVARFQRTPSDGMRSYATVAPACGRFPLHSTIAGIVSGRVRPGSRG